MYGPPLCEKEKTCIESRVKFIFSCKSFHVRERKRASEEWYSSSLKTPTISSLMSEAVNGPVPLGSASF